MQLNKYLALCGIASRRKANLIIAQKRITINDEVIEVFGRTVDMSKDKVYLDGQCLKLPQQYWYILLNKPAGVITAINDTRGRKTVLDLVHVDERVFPVGRLDYDTEGVLLLTNDGDLTYRLTHPKYEVKKVYEVLVKGSVDIKSLNLLSEGVDIKEGVVVRGDVRILDRKPEATLIEIKIHEGKKRQIKRMMKAIGHPVLHLKRTCFAGLTVDGLEKGMWRELTSEEVKELYKIIGLM